MPTKNIPLDPKLYTKVVKEAKSRFKVWPSAYASGWVVKTYIARGGLYERRTSRSSSSLSRWFKEKWINVCKLPKKVACGRKKASFNSRYPYCRPSKRVDSHTPRLSSELSKAEIRRRCSRKRSNPRKRVY